MAGVLTAGRAQRARGRGGHPEAWLLLAPATPFLLLLFVAPIGYVLYLSVSDAQPSYEHYERVFTVPLYLNVMWNTFITSLIVTVLCLALAYPVAFVMATRDDGWMLLLLTIVGISFWTGFLVRTYAWLVILGNRGPVVAAMELIGITDPPQILFTSFSSTLGLVHILLPYMVLALYSVMSKIDPNHMRAAFSLGARPLAAFRHVYLPLSMPGVVNGGVLVFTICLGFYVTPILLGTPRDMMISQLINQQIEELLAWGFASALAVVLLVFSAALLAAYNRYAGLDRLWG